ncbi:MAG: hypothetical protein AMXMBFR56_65820 [Polyangiaceae bacterium]
MLSQEGLTKRQTVVELVAVYEREAEAIRQGFALLAGAEKRLNAAFTLGEWHGIRITDRHNRSRYDWDDPKDTLEQLKRDIWSILVDRLEVQRMLSVARSKQLNEQLERGELPDITVENVFAFAQGFIDNLDEMLGEAVEEVFNFLRPGGRAAEYKTNSQLEVPRRVILTWMVDTWGYGSHLFHVSYDRAESQLRALENVFSALDGQGSIAKTHKGRLVDAINQSPDGKAETEYFKVVCYRNRNLHLEFKRLDLLEKFNRLAGGRRLRPKSDDAAA